MLPAKVKKIEIIDNNNQLSSIDLNTEKETSEKIYFESRLFKEPIEYKYLKFNLNLQEKIKKITLFYNIKLIHLIHSYPKIFYVSGGERVIPWL